MLQATYTDSQYGLLKYRLDSDTLISLIAKEAGINVEGVQK